MNKITIHFAAQVIALGMVSGAACAQSNVVIYGVADAGLVLDRGGPNGNVSNISSGLASGSRLGFKGAEDLGNGMSAKFVLESGINVDTGAAGQGGLQFGRQSWVGLSGNYGMVSLGRQYSPYYKALRDVADPFVVGLAGSALNVFASNWRIDNMVEYATASWHGVSADLAYGAGETAGDSARNRTLGGSLSFLQGPLQVVLVHHQRENPSATAHARNTMLVAKYQFDTLTLHAARSYNKDVLGVGSKDTLVGAGWQIGAGRVVGSIVLHQDDGANQRDARQYAAGYIHSLSRRTDVYTAYGHLNNRNGATYKIGNATDTGTGTTGFNLGMRHVF